MGKVEQFLNNPVSRRNILFAIEGVAVASVVGGAVSIQILTDKRDDARVEHNNLFLENGCPDPLTNAECDAISSTTIAQNLAWNRTRDITKAGFSPDQRVAVEKHTELVREASDRFFRYDDLREHAINVLLVGASMLSALKAAELFERRRSRNIR